MRAAPSAAAPSTAASAGASVATGTIHMGSNHSDPGEKGAMEAINKAFTDATGITTVLNTVDHNTFQDQLTNYLGATPDTAYTWFSGFRLKFFADQGFNIPIDDVWAKVKSNFTDGFAQSVVGNDGKVYGIPVDYYPWAVFYRKDVFADKGYTVPTTWDEFIALCQKMQGDGLTPIAFGDKDGWPAMGTFDILNLRLNGYDFHTQLLAGGQKWTDPKVTTVFQQWAKMIPFQAKDYAGLTWQQAADTLVQKKSGMYLLGLFVSAQFQATNKPEDIAALDFFPFPNLGTQYDAEKALDAPIDTWQLAAKSPNLATETDTGKAYLEFWAKGSTQLIMFKGQRRSHPDGQRRRHQHVHRPAEEGRRGRLGRPADHPVPRPRHPIRLRRLERHAELPPEVPGRSVAGSREVPGEHPGVLGRPAAAFVKKHRLEPPVSGR